MNETTHDVRVDFSADGNLSVIVPQIVAPLFNLEDETHPVVPVELNTRSPFVILGILAIAWATLPNMSLMVFGHDVPASDNFKDIVTILLSVMTDELFQVAGLATSIRNLPN